MRLSRNANLRIFSILKILLVIGVVVLLLIMAIIFATKYLDPAINKFFNNTPQPIVLPEVEEEGLSSRATLKNQPDVFGAIEEELQNDSLKKLDLEESKQDEPFNSSSETSLQQQHSSSPPKNFQEMPLINSRGDYNEYIEAYN